METAEKTGVVYRIYHKASMKSYIGKTVNPKKRIREHLNGKSSSPVLRNAINKYGADAFCVEILEKDMPEAVLSKLEILHIRFFNCKAPNGYNITDGGEGASGLKLSLETRRRISEATQGRIPWNKGKTGLYEPSLETRRKLSESHKGKPSPRKGRKHTLESRRNMSEARKGKPTWIKGKTHSAETREKISQSQKGRVLSCEHRHKISEANKGRTVTPETRRKLSESRKGKPSPRKGRKHTLESRRNMSEARKGKPTWNKGKSHSPETRRKISESLKRRNCSA